MKIRYKIIIVGIIIVLSSSSLFFYLMDSGDRVVFPGTGMILNGVENGLCRGLYGNATFGNCFGINDICEDVYGVLKYDKNRSEVGCDLHNRVTVNCTNLQLATGWEKYNHSVCYLPFEDIELDLRKNSPIFIPDDQPK